MLSNCYGGGGGGGEEGVLILYGRNYRSEGTGAEGKVAEIKKRNKTSRYCSKYLSVPINLASKSRNRKLTGARAARCEIAHGHRGGGGN